MVFFHCTLVFIIFDIIFKIPISAVQALTNRFKGIPSYILIHVLSSAGMAYIFAPYLEGKRVWLQVLLCLLMGLWGYGGVSINANNAKRKAMAHVAEEYGIVKECENRLIAALAYIPAVPLLYFLIFRRYHYQSSFIYHVIGFFSKWKVLSIVATVAGFVQFISSLMGIISLIGVLAAIISPLLNRNHK